MRWCWIALVFIAGCTYGPAEERARIENVAAQPDSYRFAAAVRYERFQPPTGLHTFPNGGTLRFLERTAVVYLVDISTDEIVRLAHIEAPEQLRTSFRVHVTGWQGERVFVSLAGCPGPECYGDLVRVHHFELSPGAAPRRIASRPRELARPPGMLARAPGEAVYMRLSTNSRTIRVRMEDGAPFRQRYKVEDSGELVPIRPTKELQPPAESGG